MREIYSSGSYDNGEDHDSDRRPDTGHSTFSPEGRAGPWRPDYSVYADDEYEFSPESIAAIEARLDEVGLPTRAESRAAAMRFDADDEDDEDGFSAESNAAIEARLDEAGLPTRSESRAAAMRFDADDEDDEYGFSPESNAAIEARLDEAGLPTRAESRAAAMRLDADDEDDEEGFSPESNAAIEARLDEAGLPTRSESRAAAMRFDAADEDDEEGFSPESNAAIEARLDEAGLPTRAESRAAARRAYAYDHDDEKDDFGLDSGDTAIEASPDPIEPARAGEPTGRKADYGAAPERRPVWMDRTDRPSDLEVTRPYNQPQGLTRPEPQHRRDLDDAVPREPDGHAERFPDPYNDWVPLVNDGGREADPLRGNNCQDCSVSFISTWHGEPTVSAPRFPDRLADGALDEVTGERHGPERAEMWLGHPYEYLGSADQGLRAIEEKLREGGHGAAAAIINTWKGRWAHAWNAVNYRGEIVWIDSQAGKVSNQPVYAANRMDKLWAIVIDREGRAL